MMRSALNSLNKNIILLKYFCAIYLKDFREKAIPKPVT